MGVNTSVNIWKNSSVKSSGHEDFWRGVFKNYKFCFLNKAIQITCFTLGELSFFKELVNFT